MRVSVRGGVIRAARPRRARIWAYEPEPQITITRLPNGQASYALDVLNINARRVRLRANARVQRQNLDALSARVSVALDEAAPAVLRFEFPEEDKKAFSFGLFSDTGGRDVYAILPRAMSDFAERRVLFAFSLGDTVGEAGRRFRTLWGAKLFDAYIRSARKPAYFVIGDNDLSRRLGQTGLAWTSRYGPNNRSFLFGAAHFVILDTSQYALSDDTLRWFARDMAAARGKQHFIFMHVPPFCNGRRVEQCMDAVSAQKLLSILKRYPGTHVYAGHLQIIADWARAGCFFHITGSAGERIRDEDSSKRHYSHMRVRFDGRRVENVRVNDGLPRWWENTWRRLTFVYPIWLATHKVEAIAACILIGLFMRPRRPERASEPTADVAASDRVEV